MEKSLFTSLGLLASVICLLNLYATTVIQNSILATKQQKFWQLVLIWLLPFSAVFALYVHRGSVAVPLKLDAQGNPVIDAATGIFIADSSHPQGFAHSHRYDCSHHGPGSHDHGSGDHGRCDF